MKRIYSLDLIKLVFAFVIAFFHFGTTVSPGPTITVQIFFIISGFFLARKYYSRSHSDGGEGYGQWQYTLDHVKSIYPHYLLALVINFLYNTARALVYLLRQPSWEGVQEICLSLYNQIPDLLLLQSAYTFHDSMNYPLWQLSALLIAGYFVYGLLCWNEKLSRRLIFPAAILMIQSLLNTGVDLWANWGVFYVPLLRAFSPLCIGVLAYYFTTLPYYADLKKHRVFFNLAVLYSIAGIFLYKDHGNIFLLGAVMMVWGCWDESSWLNKLLNYRIFRHCGGLSMAVYMNHALIARFLEARVYLPLESAGTPAPLWQKNLTYFVLLTVCSAITLWLTQVWKRHRKKKT